MTERRRYRLPREERMRGYQDVELRHADQPFDAFEGATPVAVELRRDAESLIDFDHPDRAVYVFGPEDGSLDRAVLGLCHRFVVIPTRSWGADSTNPTTWPTRSAYAERQGAPPEKFRRGALVRVA